MGIYDTVGPKYFQIKSTPDPGLEHYNEGDEIDLPDGLHLTLEGWFIVWNGIIKDIGEEIWSKWGYKIAPADLIKTFPGI